VHVPAVRVQLAALNVPVPLLVNETVPVGTIGVPAAEASATVALQDVTLFTTIEAGPQLTVVVLALRLTVMLPEPELVAWIASPP